MYFEEYDNGDEMLP